jgi:hypothetical protein
MHLALESLLDHSSFASQALSHNIQMTAWLGSTSLAYTHMHSPSSFPSKGDDKLNPPKNWAYLDIKNCKKEKEKE